MLAKILGALLLIVGYPAEDAKVPDIERKPLADYMSLIDD